MIKAFKYKLNPTFKQKKLLSQAFGNARFIYNWGLQRKKEEWETEKKTITFVELCKELTTLKNQDEYAWLNNSAVQSLQQSLRNLDSAYARFFREKKGYPKFKSKKNKHDSIKFVNNVKIDYKTRRINVARVGKVKFFPNLEIPKDKDPKRYRIGTLTITRDACGDYWATLVVEDTKYEVTYPEIHEDTAVGIDLGVRSYAILSDGTKYGNPEFLEKGQKRLEGLQRGLSKMQKGSNNYKKMRLKIARLHRKIANRRNNFIHGLTSQLVKQYDTVCLENLDVQGLLEKNGHRLSNSIASVAWSEFRRQIEYKSEMYGTNVLIIGRFEPSSKTCSNCGYVYSELGSKDKWVCPVCGEHHDRDVNAAINIKAFALSQL